MVTGDPPRRLALVIVAIVLALAAFPLYGALLDIPWARSSGLPSLVFFALAVGLALAACPDRRWWVRALAVLPIALTAFGIWSLFFHTKLPTPAARTNEMTLALDFTLPDQEGRPVTLKELETRGPTMLVFFRGSW
jgi:hypothetical protein